MRVVLTSFGTTGDVQPILALAVELQRAGHSTVIAVSPTFASRVRCLGLEFVPVGPPMDDEQVTRVWRQMVNTADPFEQISLFVSALPPVVPGMVAALETLCRDADVLVSAPYQVAGRIVRDKTGIAFATVHFSLAGSLGGKRLREASAPFVNACRCEQGLAPLPDPMGLDGPSPELALFALSRNLFGTPKAWPSRYHVTGFFFLDDDPWEPSPEFNAFASQPEPRVVFTFGSMVHEDPEALTRLLIGAVQDVRCSVAMQRGWAGMASGALPSHVFPLDFVPHHRLFPSAACIVHHGAAGTTAAAFRAGVPTVVVPHTLEQPVWGALSRSLGCTASVIPFRELTTQKLREGINRVLSSNRYREAAGAVRAQVQRENGVRTARKLLEAII